MPRGRNSEREGAFHHGQWQGGVAGDRTHLPRPAGDSGGDDQRYKYAGECHRARPGGFDPGEQSISRSRSHTCGGRDHGRQSLRAGHRCRARTGRCHSEQRDADRRHGPTSFHHKFSSDRIDHGERADNFHEQRRDRYTNQRSEAGHDGGHGSCERHCRRRTRGSGGKSIHHEQRCSDDHGDHVSHESSAGGPGNERGSERDQHQRGKFCRHTESTGGCSDDESGPGHDDGEPGARDGNDYPGCFRASDGSGSKRHRHNHR